MSNMSYPSPDAHFHGTNHRGVQIANNQGTSITNFIGGDPRSNHSHWNLPYLSDPAFIRQPGTFEQLDKIIEQSYEYAALVGVEGVGKTIHAVEYAYYLRRKSPNGISSLFWVDGTNPETWAESIDTIVNELDFTGRVRASCKGRSIEHILTACLKGCVNGRWLMVIDNYSTKMAQTRRTGATRPTNQNTSLGRDTRPSEIRILPRNTMGTILITCRDARIASSVVNNQKADDGIIRLQNLSIGHAMDVFEKVCCETIPENLHPFVRQLMLRLDCFPKAVVQVAQYLQQRDPQVSIDEVLLRSRESEGVCRLLEDISEECRMDDVAQSKQPLWHSTFDELSEVDPCCSNFLSLLSFLDGHQIPINILAEDYSKLWAGVHTNGCNAQDTNACRVQDLVTLLLDLSLLQMDEVRTSLLMGNLIRSEYHFWLQNRGIYDLWRGRYLTNVDDLLPTEEETNWTIYEMLLPFVVVREPFANEDGSHLQVKLWCKILTKVAQYQLFQGNLIEAMQLAQSSMTRYLRPKGTLFENEPTAELIVGIAKARSGQSATTLIHDGASSALLTTKHQDTKSDCAERNYAYLRALYALENGDWNKSQRVFDSLSSFKDLAPDHPFSLRCIEGTAACFVAQNELNLARDKLLHAVKLRSVAYAQNRSHYLALRSTISTLVSILRRLHLWSQVEALSRLLYGLEATELTMDCESRLSLDDFQANVYLKKKPDGADVHLCRNAAGCAPLDIYTYFGIQHIFWPIPARVCHMPEINLPTRISHANIDSKLLDAAAMTGSNGPATLTGLRVICVAGLRGVGKTLRVAKFVNEITDQFSIVQWLRAGSLRGHETYIHLARQLDLALTAKEEKQPDCISTREYLESLNLDWLLVLDDLDYQSGIHNLLPRTARQRGLILITTALCTTSTLLLEELQLAHSPIFASFVVDVLDQGQAIEFLEDALIHTSSSSVPNMFLNVEVQLHTVCSRLGGILRLLQAFATHCLEVLQPLGPSESLCIDEILEDLAHQTLNHHIAACSGPSPQHLPVFDRSEPVLSLALFLVYLGGTSSKALMVIFENRWIGGQHSSTSQSGSRPRPAEALGHAQSTMTEWKILTETADDCVTLNPVVMAEITRIYLRETEVRYTAAKPIFSLFRDSIPRCGPSSLNFQQPREDIILMYRKHNLGNRVLAFCQVLDEVLLRRPLDYVELMYDAAFSMWCSDADTAAALKLCERGLEVMNILDKSNASRELNDLPAYLHTLLGRLLQRPGWQDGSRSRYHFETAYNIRQSEIEMLPSNDLTRSHHILRTSSLLDLAETDLQAEEVLRAQKRYEECLHQHALWNDGKREIPFDWSRAYYGQAMCHLEKGELTLAETAAHEASLVLTSYLEGMDAFCKSCEYDLGKVLFSCGKNSEALAILQEVKRAREVLYGPGSDLVTQCNQMIREIVLQHGHVKEA